MLFRQAVDLSPLPADDLARYGLSSSGGAQWWGAWLDVPYSAAVLNFVFSDREQRVWDNNGQRDFHTLVAGEGAEGAVGSAVGVRVKREKPLLGCASLSRCAQRSRSMVECSGRHHMLYRDGSCWRRVGAWVQLLDRVLQAPPPANASSDTGVQHATQKR